MTGATVRGANRSLERQAVRVESFVERSSATLVVGAVTLLAALVWGRYTGRIDQWFVQTDELQIVRLAMHIADQHTLDPALRGQDVATWNQLYPLLLAPFYALLDTADAFKAAHWLNALLMSSTAIPTYLLAREVGAAKLAGYLAAALSVSVPWLALGDIVRDDAVAYPAFTWAVLLMQRALVEPGALRELLALAAILVASLARTQFVALAPALLVAVALHEASYRLVVRRARPSRAEALEVVRAHWVLVAMAAFGLVYGIVRGFRSLLGPYQSNVAGDVLPAGLVGNVEMHLSIVAVAIGVLPATFATGWAIGSLFRPESRRRQAYAVLLLVVAAVLSVVASSYVLRNAGTNPFDRYFFYLVPPALVGLVLCIDEGRRRWWLAAGAAVAFALIAGHGVWAPAPPPYHQSPASAFNSVLDFHAGRVGLTGAEAARWGGMALALAGALALRFVPRRVLLPVLGAGLLVFGVGETRSVFRTMEGTQLGPPPQNVGPDYQRAWLDAALPDGARAAVLPEMPIEVPPGDPNVNNYVSSSLWWDTEFWNESVADAYVPEDDFGADPTPFPRRVMSVDARTGRIDVAGVPPEQRPEYLVVGTARPDLRPAGDVVESTPWGLDLIRAERPYRTPWAVFGLDAGSSVYPERPLRVRLFEGAPAKVTMSVMVPYQTTPEPVERRFTLTGGGRRVLGSATSGNTASVSVCLPRAGDSAHFLLAPSPDTREGIRLRRTVVDPLPAGRTC